MFELVNVGNGVTRRRRASHLGSEVWRFHCHRHQKKWTMKAALRLTIAGLVLAANNISAQTPAELGIQTYAGLTITGAVGTVYSVEYVTDLAQSNNAAAWRCLRRRLEQAR
jgi:hypothetical protein